MDQIDRKTPRKIIDPSREEWATDFLNEAHKELNKAAAAGVLTNEGNHARLLFGQALTIVEKRPDKGSAPWPDHAIEKVKEAHLALKNADYTPEEHHVLMYCDEAVRLLEESRGIKAEFQTSARDTPPKDNPMRFFTRVHTDQPTETAIARVIAKAKDRLDPAQSQEQAPPDQTSRDDPIARAIAKVKDQEQKEEKQHQHGGQGRERGR